MILLGSIANAAAIIVGGLAGAIVKRGLSERFSNMLFTTIGLFTIAIGIMFSIQSKNIMVVILSLTIGAIIGEWIDIEKRMNNLGEYLQDRLKAREGSFSQGFVTASLFACVGSMAIMGALQGGLMNDHKILYTKAIIDGITMLILGSTMGIGVVAASVPLFIYQGTITLLASIIAPYLNEAVMLEMNATGGIILLGLGINILELKKIRVGNMLPAIFIPILLMLFI